MKYYEIVRHTYNDKEARDNYGGGYTAEEVKAVLKGYKREPLEFDPTTCFYTRKGSKYFYIVSEYERD